jgi:integrase
MRRLGPKREPGSRKGLTQKGAQEELRRLMYAVRPRARGEERLTFKQAGERFLDHVDALDLKTSTREDYNSTFPVHLAPHFGDKSLAAVEPEDVEAFIRAKRQEGSARKSVLNYIGLLHSIFAHAEQRRWSSGNPVKWSTRRRSGALRNNGEPEVRFLDQEELEALPDDTLGRLERVLYLTAAMTGLRRGELLALRWRDVDWMAARLRVCQNYVRGEFGAPKSKRSSRAVPLADRLAPVLERYFQASIWQGDDDLVFCHPLTGLP